MTSKSDGKHVSDKDTEQYLAKNEFMNTILTTLTEWDTREEWICNDSLSCGKQVTRASTAGKYGKVFKVLSR